MEVSSRSQDQHMKRIFDQMFFVLTREHKERGCHWTNGVVSMVFNAQSVGQQQKRIEIANFVTSHSLDMFFLTETWLRQSCEEVKAAELEPPDYSVVFSPLLKRWWNCYRLRRHAPSSLVLDLCRAFHPHCI